MARTLDPRIEQAKKLYDAGEKLIDIADQLGVPEGTIRSWKKRYWGNATLQKKECNVAKEKKPTKRAEQETIKEESEYLDETVELSEKQRLFCMYYIRSFNATKALDWLANHMDLATEEQRARIEQIKAQTHRLTRDEEEQEETVDDGFLKALEGTAAEDWANEEES